MHALFSPTQKILFFFFFFFFFMVSSISMFNEFHNSLELLRPKTFKHIPSHDFLNLGIIREISLNFIFKCKKKKSYLIILKDLIEKKKKKRIFYV